MQQNVYGTKVFRQTAVRSGEISVRKEQGNFSEKEGMSSGTTRNVWDWGVTDTGSCAEEFLHERDLARQ